ncbi:MAG TPA: biotin carboxylase N-terminal domain-containing protein [Trebonia sp.]|nr:biotin carboxylase N-terminal domain-containing protein [Trebonia sp.]
MPPFDTVLVANRGEIAVRVIRTLRALGIRSAAVYSDADAGARHVADADVAYRLGPAPARHSYLSIEAVVAACRATGAQAVHPGYGFLSENAAFAEALAEAGIAFIGPSARAIATMGDKITAKATVAAFGVPVVPGVAAPGLSDAELIDAAAGIAYPILVKPSAGGGGKGMRVVERPEDLGPALASARREAAASFGDDTLFLEQFVLRPRHIEVQVLADGHGNVVHLGERECSLQRRHQKVVEEAPSPLLDAATRARIGAAACDTARSVDYAGAGTVEFIVSAQRPGDFFFMEMNTRLQVEHPVTELVTGVDLVEWQVRVAAGERLPFTQNDIQLTGHAIEARVYAEDPGHQFLPTGGRVLALLEPDGPGVRVDSGLRTGTVVGSDYDPMLSKVIVHAGTRAEAINGLDRALAQTSVLGVQTNIAFLRRLLADPDVRGGRLDTSLLDRIAAEYTPEDPPDAAFLAAAASVWLARWQDAEPADLWSRPDGWRVGDRAPSRFRLSCGDRTTEVTLTGSPAAASATLGGAVSHQVDCGLVSGGIALTIDGLRRICPAQTAADIVWVHVDGETYPVRRAPEERRRADAGQDASAVITSPMPGSVVAVHVEDGQRAERGAPVLAVEAMKMEHVLKAPIDGVVEVLVKVGDQVDVDQPLARLRAPDDDAGNASKGEQA